MTWSWRGVQLEAGITRAKYFIRGEQHEVIVWAELRDLDGRRRVEIGSFRSVGEARAACEREAQLRCRRDSEERLRWMFGYRPVGGDELPGALTRSSSRVGAGSV